MAGMAKHHVPEGSDKLIQLAERQSKTVRVRITSKSRATDPVMEYRLCAPFSIGYGDACEIRLPRGNGPERLFEFAPPDRSQSISLPLGPALQQGDFEFYVNGKRFDDKTLPIKPGNTVRILDKSGEQEVELFVESAGGWRSHLKSLYAISAALFLLTVFTGYFIYQRFQATDERLLQTESRITRTQAELSDWNAAIAQTIQEFKTEQVQIEQSLQDVSVYQSRAVNELQQEFSNRIDQIRGNAQQSLSKIAEEDQLARERLQAQTESQIEQLESQMSERFVDTLEQFKAAQNELYALNTTRIEYLEQQSTVFKEILDLAQQSVVYIRTTYQVQSAISDKTNEVEHFGTGFTVSSNGLSIAPQHVLRPWLYDNNMLAMTALGQIKIDESSVRYTVWTAKEQVLDPNTKDSLTYLTDTAFDSEKTENGLVLLYTATPETGAQILTSPFGAITVQRPLVGHTDIAVFQLIDFDREFTYLTLDDNANAAEAMDEVLTVGYPLSRLHDGKSVPQGVKGFVRRQTSDLLELDSALHPGTSGAPVLNRDGYVIGMAVALINSDSYGIAVTAPYLREATDAALQALVETKQRLTESGCYTGSADGRIDAELWSAMHKQNCQ